MLATAKLRRIWAEKHKYTHRVPLATPICSGVYGTITSFQAIVIMALLLGVLPFQAMAAEPAAAVRPYDPTAFARRVEATYKAAKARYQADTNNAEAQWQSGRACFDWADLAKSSGDRAKIAEEGIAACRQLVARDTNSALGHYYLGMNLAQLAQTKSLGALKIVDEMETEFTATLNLDPKLDFAGADRNLGLLYRDAPGWPVSIGSKSKARAHLQQARKIGSEEPENLLNLVEAEVKWGDRTAVLRDMKALDELWPAAQKQLAGEEWGASWADWEKRRAEVQKKIADYSKPLEPAKKP